MTDLTLIPTEPATPLAITDLVNRARQTLAQAKSAAEVLDARDDAALAYDAAKRAARVVAAKGAADGAIAAAHRLQADALDIETAAKRRLADEVDAAQERGEVANGRDGPGAGVLDGNAKATAADIGLSRKEIHEDRKLRDAEAKCPGLTETVLNALVDAGKEPARAALGRAIDEALGDDHRETAETIAAASHAALHGKGSKSREDGAQGERRQQGREAAELPPSLPDR